MFGFKKTPPYDPIALQELLAPTPTPPVVNVNVPELQIVQEIEYRPCWVRGKRALFHRWANVARPSLPKGQEPSENARYFQYRSTQALVEFENGAVELVYPQQVHFVDGGHFKDYAWPEEGESHATE